MFEPSIHFIEPVTAPLIPTVATLMKIFACQWRILRDTQALSIVISNSDTTSCISANTTLFVQFECPDEVFTDPQTLCIHHAKIGTTSGIPTITFKLIPSSGNLIILWLSIGSWIIIEAQTKTLWWIVIAFIQLGYQFIVQPFLGFRCFWNVHLSSEFNRYWNRYLLGVFNCHIAVGLQKSFPWIHC